METQGSPNFAARLAVLLVVAGVVAALATTFVVGFLLHRPTTTAATSNPNAQGARIHLEVVGAVSAATEFPRPGDPHPDWPAFLPTTTLKVPANSLITVQLDVADSARGLRNPFWSQAQGIVGGTFHMSYFDASGKAESGDFRALDSADDASHTFAIPDLGVFVPLQALSPAAPPGSKNVITFSFRTGKAGVYRWQCFVPCGQGTFAGNGGPMQTLGYMAGQLIVQ